MDGKSIYEEKAIENRAPGHLSMATGFRPKSVFGYRQLLEMRRKRAIEQWKQQRTLG
jgi:hypothetical protein